MGVWIETTRTTYGATLSGSHPSWVCGLKQGFSNLGRGDLSHTLRGCVDWNFAMGAQVNRDSVTPFVGVWIETSALRVTFTVNLVTPFVGVWIETSGGLLTNHQLWVTPFVGVWIETILCVWLTTILVVTPFVGVWIETHKIKAYK